MALPKTTELFFAPTGKYVEARLVELTAEAIRRRIHRGWWTDDSLSEILYPMPIDRHWNWNRMAIRYAGRKLQSTKVAIVTGDQAVQGAMMMSTERVPSSLDPHAGALFVELLFTAPRNRPGLRTDGKPLFLGVGTELLSWAAWLSRRNGCEGRLLLDASPDYIEWYVRRGLQILSADPIVFEGIHYTPMELPVPAAQDLLKDWD